MGFPKALHLNSLNAKIVNWGNVDKPIDQPISKMSAYFDIDFKIFNELFLVLSPATV